MKRVNIAIMGLGTVGGGAYDLLTRNKSLIKEKNKLDISVAKILDRDAQRLISRGIDRSLITTDIADVINDASVSIVVETIGGTDAAKDFILKCLRAGKSVVTANKELISKSWAELEAAARANNVGLYFEASCVGGVPIVRALGESLQGDNVTHIMGIINGTTNYILTKMTEENLSYEQALKQAQAQGFAEANPAADVEGFDSVYKLSILASLAFNVCIPYTRVYREGITKITPMDIAYGKEMGYVLKLLGIGRRDGRDLEARVHPAFVPLSHPLAGVRNEFNAVFLKGDFADDVMLYGRGAGARPTGSAVVSDVVYCAERTEHRYVPFINDGNLSDKMRLSSDFNSKYYLSVSAFDKPGVLGKITTVLGNNGVSLKTVIQHDADGGAAPVIFLTHETSEKAVQNAIEWIKRLKEIKSVDNLIRVI